MPFVEGGIVVDAEQPQQQTAPQAVQSGFVEGGITADPTPDDSYNIVLQYNAAQTDFVPSKRQYLDFLQVSKTKPLLGETPLSTIGTAAVQTVKDIASIPYKLGEAIGQYIDPPEGVSSLEVAGATAAEIAMQSKLKAQSMGRGLIDTALNKLSDLTGKLRNNDDKYAAFLAAAEIKRQLARANAPEDQRVPASQEVLQAYGIPQEAISQEGLEVGGFLADPSSIAFAGGGKLASTLAQRALPFIPRAGRMLQSTGESISGLGRGPENLAGRFTAGVTGSERMGQAVQEGIARGATSITLVEEAAGIPMTMVVPGLGTAAKVIAGTKAVGATAETVGEATAVSGGQSLTATQRGLLGAGERIAAAEGASASARALGTALARSGLETPIRGAATILLPMAGAGAAGGALTAMTGEEGDAIAASIGSGIGFGVFDGGFKLGKTVEANVFNGARVRKTAVDDLNTRPTEVQFTYIDPVAGEQTATIKDSDARATLYGRLNNKQLTKALSEVAGAEGAGVDVIFHTDGDTVPAGLQTVNYAGVAIGPDNIKSGKPTILINVDRASPEALPHEILHARITQDMVSQLGAKAIDTASADPNFQRQFTDFANKYADKLQSAGGSVVADRIRTELRDAFDPAQQRAQKVESLKRITDEFAAYYTQEMLKGKDPKTMLPGRIPSFFEMALNNAKEAVSERFTRRALQAGFDPVARTFYDANGRRIKLDWMEDAIKNLVTPKEGYEPTEQKVDIRKMTQAQQNAVIMARGYSDLFMTAPDGSIVRPLSRAEVAARTADIANRTMRVVESVPQADRTSISGMDAYGNPVIEGRLSLAEADAVSKSGIFGPSSSRTLIDIATAIRDGSLVEGNYWKVYGPTGRSGVFGESQKLFLPYGISINSKGGVNVKVVDWGKVQARMYKALNKQAYKNLFNNYDQAMSTMRDVYLKNIAETGAVPSAEALGGGINGAKKRNMFNEIMGAVPKKGDVMVNFPTTGYVANRKGGSVYQDLRLERIQNADSTGAKIPWTGDMGEQSSYRRTQLNFMPAENIGETKVSTDENAGYRILSKNGKFRLYGPDGSTVGIFDTQEQARLKAERDYTTRKQSTETWFESNYDSWKKAQSMRTELSLEERNAVSIAKKKSIETFRKYPEAIRLDIKVDKQGNPKFEEVLDANENPVLDTKGRPLMQVAFTKVPYDLLGSPKLSKNKDRAVIQAADLLDADARKAFNNPEISKGVGWYSRMREFLQQQLGANIEVFGQLLGATSARTPVDTNFKQALEALKLLSTGQYDGLLAEFSKHANKTYADSQSGELLKQWQKNNPDKRASAFKVNDEVRKQINRFEGIPLRPNGKKYNANSQKVLHVLYGLWLEQTVGPKTPNFAGNLTGRTLKATIDVWAARNMRRLLYEGSREKWRPLPEQESGVTDPDFFFAQDVYEVVGKRLGMNPDDLQALMWFMEKDVWEKNGWTSTVGAEKSSFDKEAGKLALDRYQAGVTTFTELKNFKFDTQEKERLALRKSITGLEGLVASRVNNSSGLYDGVFEPSLDIEFSVSKNRDGSTKSIANQILEIIRVANQPERLQKDVFISQIVPIDHPNARPIMEVGFKKGASWDDIAEVVTAFQENGIDGFTIATDNRGNVIGIRAQYLPEFSAVFDSLDHLDPGFVNTKMQDWMSRVNAASKKLEGIDNVSYKKNGSVSTIVYGFEEYTTARPIEPGSSSLAQELGRRRPIAEQRRQVSSGADASQAVDPGAGGLPVAGRDVQSAGSTSSEAVSGEQRFMPASDTDYLSAVKQGDTATAQRMVDEAAKKARAGFPNPVINNDLLSEDLFWRLQGPDFQLNPNFKSTSQSDSNYQEKGLSVWNSLPELLKNMSGGMADYVRGNVDIVAMFGKEVGTGLDNEPVVIPSAEAARFHHKNLDDRKKSDDFYSAKEMKENANEIDTIDEFLEPPWGWVRIPELPMEFDPVTYDKSGNVIPLSQRFKATSGDIRYMPETIQRDVGRNQDFANPPTDTEAVDALSSEKKAKFGAARSIKPGTQVAARIDIPAFLRTGKYVVAVHEPDGAAGGPGKVIGYDTVTRLQNPKFVVKPGVQRIYEGKSAKFPVATVDGKIMADRSIPADLENYVAVGMDPKEHAFFYDKRTDQPVISGSESVSVGNTVFVKNPVYGKPEDFRYMPQPDAAMPGAYSFTGGYRALPGKAKGSLRLYGPAGSLVGIASSLDEAQRILRRKNK
jgi:hypothetical protein